MSCPRPIYSGGPCIDYIRRWDADEDDEPEYDERDEADELEQQRLDEGER